MDLPGSCPFSFDRPDALPGVSEVWADLLDD